MWEVWAAVIGAVGAVVAAVTKVIFARGRRGEGFPGLEEIPGSVKLSVVRHLVLDDA